MRRLALHALSARGKAGVPGLLLLTVPLALLPLPAQAWGFTAHRLVHRKAVETLPEPLRAFFERNAAWVVEHSIDPDLERSSSSQPGHFLDMDSFGEPPFEAIPRVESEHLRRHGADAVSKGRVPWRVAEVYAELVDAFRSGDAARSLDRAAHLGHYVSDAHVPLHAVTNYDGQLTGQTGLHSRWESALVERFERQVEPLVTPQAAMPVGDPLALLFAVLSDSFARAQHALASDRAVAGPKDLAATPFDDRYDDRYYSRLYEREAESLRTQLTRSATRVGSLWLQAWQEAGEPPLDLSFQFPYVRRQSKAVWLHLEGVTVDDLEAALASGRLPRLARLRERGVFARLDTSGAPSRGAFAASLFTGVEPGASVTDASGSSTSLAAEPLWVTAARQGLSATVVGPFAAPFDPYLQERRFGANYGRQLTLLALSATPPQVRASQARVETAALEAWSADATPAARLALLARFADERTAWDLLVLSIPDAAAALSTPARDGSGQPGGGPSWVDDVVAELSGRADDEPSVFVITGDGVGGAAPLVVAGAGVAAQLDLGIVAPTRLAPTLATLLGLEPPAQASGDRLSEVLARLRR